MTLDDLITLQRQLIDADTVRARNEILEKIPAVRKLFHHPNVFSRFLKKATPDVQCVLKQLVAIGQGLDVDQGSLERWRHLADTSQEIERFYREIGGLVGYQVSILQMLQKTEAYSSPSESFYSPVFHDISELTDEVSQSILAGLQAMPMLAELYPLGGAADRLHLVDHETGVELPAAKLEFAGRTLLETLLRDLLAREWLYYRLYGQQITTPVAIMTSYEKDNHRHVLQICEQNGWFGRPKESFRLFVQPLVPAVDEQGNWYTTGSCRLFLKPGGHGAIWKLARDEGVFDWLKALSCKKALVRQINNPIAGLDYGLVAFVGIGAALDMSFGFASCCRRVSSAEGIVVLKETNDRIVLTNIEYCDFVKKGIVDEPVESGGMYSRFTSNTNILFADLHAVEQAVSSHPFPGLLMNLKPAQLIDESGAERQVMLARLESTMQNIADAFDEPKRGSNLYRNNLKNREFGKEAPQNFDLERATIAGRQGASENQNSEAKPAQSPGSLKTLRLGGGTPPKTDSSGCFGMKTEKTFVTYNRRQKTISVAKKVYHPGKSLFETPECCFYELLQASRELLTLCGFHLPEQYSLEECMLKGPDCVFLYHPALGPFYSIIQQKLRGGRMSRGSEFVLEIAELDAANVIVDGSFRIVAKQPLGACDEAGIVRYSSDVGQCILRDVYVHNLGIDWDRTGPFWKMNLARKESVEIILKGRSIFDAQGVVFRGTHTFVVEDGVRMTVRERDGKMTVVEEPVIEGLLWQYVWENGVKLHAT